MTLLRLRSKDAGNEQVIAVGDNTNELQCRGGQPTGNLCVSLKAWGISKEAMMQAQTAFIAISVTAALLTGACTTVVREPAPPQRVVYREMPPPLAEVRPSPAMAGYNWVPGHYAWRESEWRWQHGYYVQAVVLPMPPVIVEQVPLAPSPQHFYVRGHWQWGGSDWVWVRGHWLQG